MILLTSVITILTVLFLIMTLLFTIYSKPKETMVSAALLLLCIIFSALIGSSLVQKDLLNSNCGTNFSHAEVLFANSTVKNIYESKGSCYPKLEEEEFQ